MTREEVIGLIERRYFGGVEARNWDRVAACFTPDATVLIRHGDAPLRVFKATEPDAAAGELPMRAFYDHLWDNWAARFTEFEHAVDLEAGRAASTFLVTFDAREEGAYAEAGRQYLRNANFFSFRDGKIAHMIIYYANEGAAAGTPTGFPPAQ